MSTLDIRFLKSNCLIKTLFFFVITGPGCLYCHSFSYFIFFSHYGIQFPRAQITKILMGLVRHITNDKCRYIHHSLLYFCIVIQPIMLLYFYYIFYFKEIQKCPLKMQLEVIFKAFMMPSSVMKSSLWVNIKVEQITSHFY